MLLHLLFASTSRNYDLIVVLLLAMLVVIALSCARFRKVAVTVELAVPVIIIGLGVVGLIAFRSDQASIALLVVGALFAAVFYVQRIRRPLAKSTTRR